jgi:hypothetical protein
MARWIPVLTAVIPHLTQLVSAAAPAFTTRQGAVAQQIAELQAAAAGNARGVKDVAEQLQQVARAMEEMSAAHQSALQQLKAARTMSYVALAVAVAALIGILVLLATRL